MTSPRPLHSLALLIGACLLGAGLLGCASNRPVGDQVGDAALATKVESKLAADPEVNNFKIDVDVQEGVVRLSGTVAKEEVRSEAEDLARYTKGVVDVVNEIEIGSRGIGDRVSDGAITAKIKSKLIADPEINPFSIDVDTIDGVVTLTGRVADERRSEEAEKLARNTKGVRDVKNQLRIGDQSSGGEGGR
jgi:hyperosmotically inducible protein